MKLTTIIAAFASISATVATYTPAQYGPWVVSTLSGLNDTAKNFANHTSLIKSGENYHDENALYNTCIDIAELTMYTMEGQFIFSWFEPDHTDVSWPNFFSDAFFPIFTEIAEGIVNIYNKAPVIPNDHSPLPHLLMDFADVFDRFISGVDRLFPTQTQWVDSIWKTIHADLDYTVTRLGQSQVTSGFYKRQDSCDGDGCPYFAAPGPLKKRQISSPVPKDNKSVICQDGFCMICMADDCEGSSVQWPVKRDENDSSTTEDKDSVICQDGVCMICMMGQCYGSSVQWPVKRDEVADPSTVPIDVGNRLRAAAEGYRAHLKTIIPHDV